MHFQSRSECSEVRSDTARPKTDASLAVVTSCTCRILLAPKLSADNAIAGLQSAASQRVVLCQLCVSLLVCPRLECSKQDAEFAHAAVGAETQKKKHRSRHAVHHDSPRLQPKRPSLETIDNTLASRRYCMAIDPEMPCSLDRKQWACLRKHTYNVSGIQSREIRCQAFLIVWLRRNSPTAWMSIKNNRGSPRLRTMATSRWRVATGAAVEIAHVQASDSDLPLGS
ncbi:hypothetical protein PHSY_003350 [Pseudozyma hubeiensis SY62]|uniref:Uncharacterized protein n=1 Tax=Pseudozyma hubeiensis (strain SY62) TaxID=1305764 RepID=R9P3A2_PSEHS|nr:hypothetical protein PHSY_003350 [Pseudozyma hubeiensis SY62]GAC95774.1 hypothetical protein PHSY_003350 [Pseudozyma hubeiensis SY62]